MTLRKPLQRFELRRSKTPFIYAPEIYEHQALSLFAEIVKQAIEDFVDLYVPRNKFGWWGGQRNKSFAERQLHEWLYEPKAIFSISEGVRQPENLSAILELTTHDSQRALKAIHAEIERRLDGVPHGHK